MPVSAEGLSRTKAAGQLSDLAERDFRALHIGDVSRGWTPAEPFDECMNRSGLADSDYFDAAIRKIARVTATTELLRALPRRGAIENALHAPGHVTAPRDDRRQGNSTRVAAGLGGTERFGSFVPCRDGIAPSFAISAPL